jgi:hypothetical protein
MQPHPDRDEYMTACALPDDWAKLIRKLRWIGQEDDANRLQQAVRRLQPETRDVSGDPFITTD